MDNYGFGGLEHGLWERSNIVVDWIELTEFTDYIMGIFVGLMGRNRGELFDKEYPKERSVLYLKKRLISYCKGC